MATDFPRVRIMSRSSMTNLRMLVSMLLGDDARVVQGRFVVNVPANGEAATLAGGCRDDSLTDRPEGCEAIAATVIVIPHVGVQLPRGTSVEYFLRASDSIFATDDVIAAIRRAT